MPQASGAPRRSKTQARESHESPRMKKQNSPPICLYMPVHSRAKPLRFHALKEGGRPAHRFGSMCARRATLLETAHPRLKLGSATASRPYPAFAWIRVHSRLKNLSGFRFQVSAFRSPVSGFSLPPFASIRGQKNSPVFRIPVSDLDQCVRDAPRSLERRIRA